MTVKYSKGFSITGAITGEPVTLLIEYVQVDDFKGISIESLEGTYPSGEEFQEAYKRALASSDIEDAKIYNFIPLELSDAKRLNTVLGAAIATAEEV